LNKTENSYRLFSSDYKNWQTVKLIEHMCQNWWPAKLKF